MLELITGPHHEFYKVVIAPLPGTVQNVEMLTDVHYEDDVQPDNEGTFYHSTKAIAENKQ